MTDKTIIVMDDGSQWAPSTSTDTVCCVHCGNEVDTPEEVATYPHGNCPSCNGSWTGAEQRSTTIVVTAPQAVRATTF
jgi:uncharacterized paraquat-inducible protein A